MIREINTSTDISVLDEELTGGLGRLIFRHPTGTFALTPASNILIEAIIKNKDMLHGVGIDWGSGVGCLAILAAKIGAVDKVYGLEISEENVNAATKNAEENKIGDKVSFILADSYVPYSEEGKQKLEKLQGKINFILSNPPSSDGDDGFGFRRIVLEGAKKYLIKDGLVFLNISFQYGAKRVGALNKNIKGLRYMGVVASTDCVPFDLSRPDLLECLKTYAREEINGGIEYTFIEDQSHGSALMNAQTALENYLKSGISPLTKWQTHLFKYTGGKT